uniref:Cation/H+ exchanger domain-containing protein n=1 Tax=Panagrolaimus davidi TaxID=227884 RepID=A0A914Q9C3_9BILA
MGRNFKSNFIKILLILLLTLNLTFSNPILNETTLISEHVKDAIDQAIFSKSNLTNISWDPNPVGNKPPALHLPNNLTVIIEDNSHIFEEKHQHSVHVFSFKFEYVKAELVLCTFIILIGLFKLIYHEMPFIKDWLPESCCLIALGCAIGGFIRFVAGNESAQAVRFLEFDSKVFFFFLLPPIILEAAYDLNDKAFVNNLGTIILYAVVGTVLNIFIIGGGLILCGWLGFFGTFGIHALDTLIFASLIAAVDPVAVLAIFKEVGVNKVLYFMVFGESLLNDAVTVVCYNLIGEFKNLETIRLYDVR